MENGLEALGEACSSLQFPKAGSGLLMGILFCLTCSQNHLVIKKPHPPLVISSAAHLGFDSQSGEFPQCDARRGYIQNIPFTGGTVKKMEIIHAYLTCLVFRHPVTLGNPEQAL